MCDFSPECITIATPLANKVHECCECGGVIRKGERYTRISGVWDHQPARYKQCQECAALFKELSELIDDDPDELCFGSLSECLSGGDSDWSAMQRKFLSNLHNRGGNPEKIRKFEGLVYGVHR